MLYLREIVTAFYLVLHCNLSKQKLNFLNLKFALIPKKSFSRVIKVSSMPDNKEQGKTLGEDIQERAD